jgi:ATP-dependent Clp protease ATP-binding subunit ClpX
MTGNPTKARCTFCAKTDAETTSILAFPNNLFICDECVVLMVEIIAEGHDDWRKQLIEKLQTTKPSA